jgi:signal transduction histidine kinase
MNYTPEAPIQHHLMQLAAYIETEREAVLAHWRESVNADPQLANSSQWTRAQFHDHVPYIIDTFVAKLRAWPHDDTAPQQQRERLTSNAHAQHRWQQGYDLRSLTREWGQLNFSIIGIIDRYEMEQVTLPRGALTEARCVWAEMYNESLSESVVEYHRLLQAEAAMRANELKSALEELRELERARGEVLRSATHDLRGSLNIVSGSMEIMNGEDLPPQMREQGQQMLKRGVSALNHMLSDLMDMARLEAGQEQRHIEPFDAAKVLAELCDASRGLAESRGLQLNCEGQSTLPVEGDRVKMHRIAQNLLLNAIKYTHRGGVTVSWNLLSSDRWMLTVQDTGPGIHANAAPFAKELESATHIAHAIENDHDEKNLRGKKPTVSNTSGTTLLPAEATGAGEGIGLSIVKRLCELLDASLELESTPGIGTLFRVTFPLRYLN